jgi:membrane associated rhomboid family serine protease
MFFPLSAGKRAYGTYPWATLAIITLNTFVFAWEAWLWATQGRLGLALGAFWSWGFVPGAVLAQEGPRALTAFTAMYLHGDPGHIFFNMLYFWVFGPLVEDLMGSARFAVFYHLAGLCGAALTLMLDPVLIPNIGASGAVAGVMGAFLLLYPGQRVRTLLLIPIPLWPRLPAWLVLGGWIVNQAAMGQAVLELGYNDTGIGVWAHLGGFVGGLLLASLMLKPEVVFNRQGVVA